MTEIEAKPVVAKAERAKSIDDDVLRQHRTFMDAFGGDAALAAKLSLRRQTVHQWRIRGIAWRWRARLVRMATQENIPIPPDFFELGRPRKTTWKKKKPKVSSKSRAA